MKLFQLGVLVLGIGLVLVWGLAPRPAAGARPAAAPPTGPFVIPLQGTPTPTGGIDLVPDAYLFYSCTGAPTYYQLFTWATPPVPFPITTTMRFQTSTDLRDFLVPPGGFGGDSVQCPVPCVTGSLPYTLTVDLYNQVAETNETNNSINAIPHIVTVTPCAIPTRTPTYTATPTGTGTATLTPTSTPCLIQFSDVDQTNPFYAYIRCLACRGIVSGYSDGTFRWTADVTRGQVSKMITGAAGFTDPIPSTQQTFEDVPPSHPFWLWVERLAAHGAISGYGCGGPGEPCLPPGNRPYFRPNAPLTRGQLAKIDAQAAGYQDAIPSNRQTFDDVPTSNAFWLYIERVALHGIISGYACQGALDLCTYPPHYCTPTGNIVFFHWCTNTTRGQTAKIVANTFFPACQTPAMSNER